VSEANSRRSFSALTNNPQRTTNNEEKTGTDSIFGEKSRPWEELEEERGRERRREKRERKREKREGGGGTRKMGQTRKDLSVPIFAFVFS